MKDYSMDENESDELLQEVLAQLDDGKTYAEIREQLQGKAEEKTISYVIRLADELIMEENRIRSEYKKSMFKVYMGVGFTVLTLLVFLELYFREGVHPVKKLLTVLPLAIAGYFLVKSYLEARGWKKAQPEVDDSKLKFRRTKKS
ncbi:MAG: hypothetical protein U5K79_14675 [Cyclobacteriaceae bacterium]|nr:hypothetical protein [Cyclobacteriaceae bacterium]